MLDLDYLLVSLFNSVAFNLFCDLCCGLSRLFTLVDVFVGYFVVLLFVCFARFFVADVGFVFGLFGLIVSLFPVLCVWTLWFLLCWSLYLFICFVCVRLRLFADWFVLTVCCLID